MIETQILNTQNASDPKVDVLFRGEILQGCNADEVKLGIGRLFNLAPDRLDQLFASDRCYLKRNIDRPTADKIQAAMASVGAVAHIEQPEPINYDAVTDTSSSATESPSLTLAPVGVNVLDEDDKDKQPVSAVIDEQKLNTMVIEPVGTELLTAAEVPEVESQEIEISHLTLKDQ